MSGEAREQGTLVVLSNRLPVTVREGRRGPLVERSTGGLVAALEPALSRRGGTWIGWSGAAGRGGARLPAEGYRLLPVQLGAEEVRLYYHGFSNRTLWPLLHSLPTRMQLDAAEWVAYEAVNQRFAHLAAEAAAGPGALIWIHDYQLLRAGAHLRRLRPEARLAFFLHVPFPPYDLFRILPWARELLRGLLACDLVGFHSPGYAANFFDCCERILGLRVDRERGQVEHGSRTVSVGSFPLGIDYALVERRAREAAEHLVHKLEGRITELEG